jgi:hypothetical protein
MSSWRTVGFRGGNDRAQKKKAGVLTRPFENQRRISTPWMAAGIA